MTCLLVALNAKYIHSNPAVYSLRAYAMKKAVSLSKNWKVEIAEYTINHRSEQILADIYRRKPEMVAFSCYIWNMEMAEQVIRELPKILPGAAIWAGGPEVSYEPEAVLERLPELSGIMTGEGEETFTELLACYEEEDTADLRRIGGLCLKEGQTGSGKLLEMDDLPFLYEDMTNFENRIVYYESSRGCPFRCSYCLSSIDKSVRLKSLERVYGELQFFLDRNLPQVKFIDRTFNCNHEHAMGIWEYLRNHDNGITNFHFEIAADILREDEIRLLNRLRPGLVQLEIGVQTTNEQTLHAIKRHMDIEKLKEVVAGILAGKNIHIHLDLIAGLPYEDFASFRNSFNEVYAMKPHQLQLGFLKVLKGSAMHAKAGEYGIIYTDKPPYEVLYSNWLPYAEILRLKAIEEMVELYYNSGQFGHVLAVLEQVFPSPFQMFEGLAAFYEQEGYFLNSPARAYRYHVLLKFAESADGERIKLYEELCTLDMYLRENLKSRPDFAKDLTPYYNGMKEFYVKEERERKVLQEEYEGLPSKTLMKMTHMERFHYPVWLAGKGKMEILEKPVYVLFDYTRRNPLTREASVVVLP